MKDRCFMLRSAVAQGGNAKYAQHVQGTSHTPLIIRRTAAIGDALCATVVSDRLYELGYEVEFQTHSSIHCLLRRHPTLFDVTPPSGRVDVNLDGAYENDPDKKRKHFHKMFFERAHDQLRGRGIQIGPATNCRPRIRVPQNSREAVVAQLSKYPRPWVFICPRSNSYKVRQVPDGIWHEAAQKIKGTVFWIGTHPAPPSCVDLQARHFDHVIEWMAVADLLISVDTGPMHVAAALGTPVIAIGQSSDPELHLNDQNDFIVIYPELDCLGCMQNLCPIDRELPPCQKVDPDKIAGVANARLDGITSGKISAVVPIYRPEVSVLNRCLECLIPQVDEVIVTAHGDSRPPVGKLLDPKVRYVRKMASGMGLGQNLNYGMRHTNHQLIVMLNDDVFLDPGAVEAMRREFRDGVGMVSQFLRYPDGTIYHAGKYRSPGVRGWGHIDHRKLLPTIRQPVEMENMNLASFMIRREVFYQRNGFDEDFYLYAEDDDLCLGVRQNGWKLVYTPHATGIHMEGQSTRKVDSITRLLQRANETFTRKWSWYLDQNINTIPGVFSR